MVQLSGFGKPKTLKIRKSKTSRHKEKIIQRNENAYSNLSSSLEELKEMTNPTLIDHIYRCMDIADKSLAELELFLSFSALAGFDVPTEAYLAFKASRGFLKLAKTKTFNFVDAVVDGIGLAVPSARLAGYTNFPVLNRAARVTQFAIKKGIKGEKINPLLNGLGMYSAVVPSITSKKVGASTAGLMSRRIAALSAVIPKKANKPKK
jgi:hypothetical protein